MTGPRRPTVAGFIFAEFERALTQLRPEGMRRERRLVGPLSPGPEQRRHAVRALVEHLRRTSKQ